MRVRSLPTALDSPVSLSLVVPTYNERDRQPDLVEAIFKASSAYVDQLKDLRRFVREHPAAQPSYRALTVEELAALPLKG